MEIFTGYLAWLDVLGFKDILRRNPSFMRNQRLLLQMFEYSVVHGQRMETETHDGKKLILPDASKKCVHAFMMSDTFVLFTRNVTSLDLRNLLYAVWWLMPSGFIALDEDLALRGSVTKGEIQIFSGSSPLLDNIMVFQGSAVFEAVELEADVRAGVCVLSDALVKDLDFDALNTKVDNKKGVFNPVLRWDIPVRDGSGTEVQQRYVINWARSPVNISTLTKKFQRMIDHASDGWPKAIAENTKEFYESVVRGHRPDYNLLDK